MVTAEYVDLGVSGSNGSRPELNRMLAAAHSRAVDAVVCWKLDRLGRSLKHLVTTIEDLSVYGVAFISLRDNLDLGTPSGRLMMHIVGAMAQFERELIKERVSAGMQVEVTKEKYTESAEYYTLALVHLTGSFFIVTEHHGWWDNVANRARLKTVILTDADEPTPT